VRKIRTAVGSRGKRGGARVIYYWASRKGIILLLFAYAKNEATDLTPKQISQLGSWLKRSSPMKAKMFNELLESVREGGAMLRGEKQATQRRTIEASGVRAIRQRTQLSQSEFAQLVGVSIKTLQNWEQDRRRPTGPAATLLRIIDKQPKFAIEAIHRP